MSKVNASLFFLEKGRFKLPVLTEELLKYYFTGEKSLFTTDFAKGSIISLFPPNSTSEMTTYYRR